MDEFIPDFSLPDLNLDNDSNQNNEVSEYTNLVFGDVTYTVLTTDYIKAQDEGRTCIYINIDKSIEFITKDELEKRQKIQRMILQKNSKNYHKNQKHRRRF